jgi:hypothetical protein
MAKGAVFCHLLFMEVSGGGLVVVGQKLMVSKDIM